MCVCVCVCVCVRMYVYGYVYVCVYSCASAMCVCVCVDCIKQEFWLDFSFAVSLLFETTAFHFQLRHKKKRFHMP